MKARALALAATLALAACAPPTVPDMTYYRLPPPSPELVAKVPTLALPVDVSVFVADGLYAEQAMIYTPTDDSATLRGYHYQLWVDPPARLLQRRLIALMRQAKAAPLVSDRLPASEDSLRVYGLILRLDRTKAGESYNAKVVLQLRVEHAGALLLERTYGAEAPAAGKGLRASVDAFGVALDQVYGEFLADLGQLDVKAP